jgi:hypothetical protein
MVKSDISIELYWTLDGYRVVVCENGKIVFVRTYALRQVALKACERLAKSRAVASDGQNRGRE